MTTANITWVEDMQFVGQGETGHADRDGFI